MLKLVLFDLDETLVQTTDMKELRESGKGRTDAPYVAAVQAAFQAVGNRHLYSPGALAALRNAHPELKLGIFTRSPRGYAQTVLAAAYPGFAWDVLVAAEDVGRTKPYGDGILQAAHAVGMKYANEVALVGDSDSDVCAAYNAGVYAIVDRRGWPQKRESDHWRALGHVPDAFISTDAELLALVADPDALAPELEWRLAQPEGKREKARFDRIGKFLPSELGGTNKPYYVHVAGRSFSRYDSLANRRQWHGLTTSIQENKASEQFPPGWVSVVSAYLRTTFPMQLWFGKVVVTVIPHRPERPPRLERFLGQVAAAMAGEKAALAGRLTFVPDLLAYRPGVKSNSNEHLGKNDRFINVRDHLTVNRPDLVVKGTTYVVIDDVTTTGSTLIYAERFLQEAGANAVSSLALAMAVSNVLPTT
jgi:phosphoglycolate phosphatase-like HAD superfamily hydrolase